MRTARGRTVMFGLALLITAVWAVQALGFHFEGYTLCEAPALYAWACDSTDSCLISVEPIQFDLTQRADSAGDCSYASCESYIGTGDCGFSFHGKAESWFGCDSLLSHTLAGVYSACSGDQIFGVTLLQDPGDPPICALSFSALCSAARGPCSNGGPLAAQAGVSLRLNGQEILGGLCGLWGDSHECSWDSSGVISATDGDYLEFAVTPLEIQAIDNLCAPFWAEISLSVEIGNCESSVCGRAAMIAQPVYLRQNSPNPFISETAIPMDLSIPMHVNLGIYTPEGQRVSLLADVVMPAGRGVVTWRGRNDLGERLPPGIYFCHLEADGLFQTKKMLLLK